MGVALSSILNKREINFAELRDKILVVDGQNMLYQFITTIRQQDGSFLTDSHGNVTSHLIGLISRISNFLNKKMKLVFVFDGKVPELKHKELENRKKVKIEAQKKYEQASSEKNIEDMKKYASRTSRLTPEMVNEAKLLLEALGIPVIQAPSEGEAQAAHIVSRGDAYAVVSQDADALLFGGTRVIRNLSISGRRKRGASYESVSPELIELSKNLNELGIDQDQLILLGMLIGTDFNPKGIKGIGPKKGIELVREYKNPEELFKQAAWDENFEITWKEVFKTFKEMPVTNDYKIEWSKVNKEKIIDLLVNKHDFSADRVNSFLEKIESAEEEKKQRSLLEFK